jgi:MFS family permease
MQHGRGDYTQMRASSRTILAPGLAARLAAWSSDEIGCTVQQQSRVLDTPQVAEDPAAGITLERGSLLTGPFVALCIANFLAFLGVTMLFLLPVFLRRLGGNESDIGLVMGAGQLGAAVAIPVVGVLSDRIGRRRFLLAGYVLLAGGALGLLLVDELGPLLYVLRVIQGFGFAGCLVAGATMITDMAPPRRLAQAIGLYGVATLVTHALGPAIAEAISVKYSFRVVFIASFGFQLAGLLMSLRIRETRHTGIAPVAEPLWRIALRPQLRMPLLAGVLQATSFGAVVNFLPDYVSQHRFGRVSPYFIAYSLSSLVVRVGFGDLSDRVGRRRVALPTFFGYSLGMLMLAWLTASWQLWPIGALLGLTHGLSYPALNAMAVERGEPAIRGRVMSLYNLSFNIGMTLGAFVCGAIAHAAGYPTMYMWAAVIVVMGAALVAADNRVVKVRA